MAENGMPVYPLALQRNSAHPGDCMKLRKLFFIWVGLIVLCSCTAAPVDHRRQPPSPQSQLEKLSATPQNRLLINADGLSRQEEYSQAQRLYQQYLIVYPDGERTDRALMGLGHSQAMQEAYDDARSTYDQLIESFPASTLVPVARVRIN